MESETRKKMRYAGYMAIILLLILDIIFLLSTCTEKTVPGLDKPLSGKKVTVYFSLNGSSYEETAKQWFYAVIGQSSSSTRPMYAA